MDYHPLTQKIKNLLTEHKVWFETFEHEPVTTSEEAANVRTGGYTIKQGAKALILRIKQNGTTKFVMAVLPGDQKFSKQKIQHIFNSKDLRFATVEEISEITDGVQIGGVPPFGNLFGLEVVADESLFINEKIIFNAGDRRYSIAMKSEDYKKVVNPTVASIV